MASYLAQVVIGDLALEDAAPVDGVTIRHAFAPSVRDAAAEAAAATPDMLTFLSTWFGPYPFTTYGILAPGGGLSGLAFEAQTFSVFAPDIFGQPRQASALLVHELAHQWFGDWVSPDSWRETWLNEGFATYAEWLWSDVALDVPLSRQVEEAYAGTTADPEASATDPGRDEMFSRHVYERGALTLHALRATVGDDAFIQILRTYLDRFGGKTATTADFVGVASEIAGRDLESFFGELARAGRAATAAREPSARRTALLPEGAPGRPDLRELARAHRVLGPVGGREPEWRRPDLTPVPEQVRAAHEEPVTVAPRVRVAVLDRLHDPLAIDLDLPAAVDDAGGAVLALEVDEVRPDVEDRDADLAERPVEELLERGPTKLLATDLHVVDEQLDERVEVACIGRDGVARRELTDLLVGEETLDRRVTAHARCSRTRHSARSVSSWRKKCDPATVTSGAPAAAACVANHSAGRFEESPCTIVAGHESCAR